MDDNLLKALLAVASAIAGATIAGFANAYAANRRIEEIQIQHAHKLKENYLENARKMSEQVYIPINIILSELSMAYDTFRLKVDYDNETAPQGSLNYFTASCRSYLKAVDDLLSRGADAYLTVELDETIRGFNSFVRESLNTNTVSRKVVLDFTTGFLGIPSLRYETRTSSRFVLSRPAGHISILGLSAHLNYKEELLAAPLPTRAFEQRLQKDILALKSLIKEVTLGSRTA